MSAQLDPPTPATDWTLCPGQEVRGFCLICLPPPTFSFLFFFFFSFPPFCYFCIGVGGCNNLLAFHSGWSSPSLAWVLRAGWVAPHFSPSHFHDPESQA